MCPITEATAVVEEEGTKRIEPHLDKVYIEIKNKPQYGQNIKYKFNIFRQNFIFIYQNNYFIYLYIYFEVLLVTTYRKIKLS